MQLDQKDVEVIANARVSRREKNLTNKWGIGAVIAIAIGAFLAYQVNMYAGYGLVVIAVLAFLYYNNQLSKKQTIERTKLVREWYDEKKIQGAK